MKPFPPPLDPSTLDFSAIDARCFGKTAYSTPQEADRQRERFARRDPRSRNLCRSYKCATCRRWHLTRIGGGR